MATMTSFYAEECCRLVTAHAAFARRPLHPPAVYQFLLYSTFELVDSEVAILTRKVPKRPRAGINETCQNAAAQ